jgi:hypothetical protein
MNVELTRRSLRSLKGAIVFQLDNPDAATARGTLQSPHGMCR